MPDPVEPLDHDTLADLIRRWDVLPYTQQRRILLDITDLARDYARLTAALQHIAGDTAPVGLMARSYAAFVLTASVEAPTEPPPMPERPIRTPMARFLAWWEHRKEHRKTMRVRRRWARGKV